MTSKILYPDFRSFDGGFEFGGQKFPAVTWAVKHGVPADFDDYLARMAAQHALDHFDELAVMTRQQAVRRCIHAGKAYRDERGKLGGEVHKAIRRHLLGDRPVAWKHPEAEAHFDQFLNWFRAWSPDVIAAEATGFNRKVGYGGTIDLLVGIPSTEECWLVDVKCAPVVRPSNAVQLAALERLEFLAAPDRSEWPMPPIDRSVVLRLTPDGHATHTVDTGEATFRTFRAALAAVAPWCAAAHDVDLGVIRPPAAGEVAA
jgi:hypothetical protein